MPHQTLFFSKDNFNKCLTLSTTSYVSNSSKESGGVFGGCVDEREDVGEGEGDDPVLDVWS